MKQITLESFKEHKANELVKLIVSLQDIQLIVMIKLYHSLDFEFLLVRSYNTKEKDRQWSGTDTIRSHILPSKPNTYIDSSLQEALMANRMNSSEQFYVIPQVLEVSYLTPHKPKNLDGLQAISLFRIRHFILSIIEGWGLTTRS